MRDYIVKMRGGAARPQDVALAEVLWSGVGSMLGIGLCAYLSTRWFEPYDMPLLIASFGASAVLVYAVITSPMAQPRNLLGGHVVSGFMGVLCYKLFGGQLWLAAALAVSLAIVGMSLTRTLHPPGGATALIAVVGSEKIHALGFLYPLIPAGCGALLLLLVALVVNNMASSRRYPVYWF